MVFTKMIRYDNKDNIVFEKEADQNGVSINTKKDLQYDENGNVIEVHEVVTLVDPTKPEPKILSDTTSNFEYIEYCGKSALTKVIKDGLEQQKSEYKGRYTAANGDILDNSTATTFIYSDYIDPETNKKTLVNTIKFETYQLTKDVLDEIREKNCIFLDAKIPDKFDVITIYSESSTITGPTSETISLTIGNTDIAAYTRKINWIPNEDYGIMKETFWEETEESNGIRYFNEYNTEYKIDRNYIMIETLVEKELLSEISLSENHYSKKVINDQTGLPFYFYKIKEEREYGTVIVDISEDSNHDIIARTERLDGQIIFQSYVKYDENNEKHSYTIRSTEFEQIGIQWLKTMDLSADENGTCVIEYYAYDSLGRMILRTIRHKEIVENKEQEYEGHVIYNYDDQGKCISEITENSISTYLYDNHGRKVFVIDNVNYPLSKEIFDLHFNKLLDIVE